MAMTLQEYRRRLKMTQLALAKAIGISPETISRIEKGGKPLRITAYQIERMTNGKVKARDLMK